MSTKLSPEQALIKRQSRLIDKMIEQLERVAYYESRNPMSAPSCIVGTGDLLREVRSELNNL